MSQNNFKPNECLIRAMYHVHFAQEYLECFSLDCRQEAKRNAKSWVSVERNLKHNIHAHLNDFSKKLIDEEITKGDPMAYADVFDNMLKMTPEQRQILELAARHILAGDIKVEYDEEQNKPITDECKY